MANYYLFENNWLKGPFTETELLKKFQGVPNSNVPPIWMNDGIDWLTIVQLRLKKSIDETQILTNEEGLFGHLPPGDLMFKAFQLYDKNPSLKEKLQILFRDFRATGDPELLDVAKSHLRKKGLKKTNKFGAYKIVKLLGEGGMGKTYKALQVNMDRFVALKVLKSELVKDAQFVKDFANEAKAIASLNHPNIVHAYESGTFGGRQYLCMEFVDGESLKAKIHREKRIPIIEAIQIVLKVLEALQHAYEKKIVHRDITPGNILISKTGEVKVTDYGLARKISGVGDDPKNSGIVRGSPFFISPEQIQTLDKIDIRADLYGLGCTFYYMLTGELPYKGNSIVEVAKMHLKAPIPNVQEKLPEAIDSLKKVLDNMLAKERENRYTTPQEVLVDLIEIRDRYVLKDISLNEARSDNLNSLSQKIAQWEKNGELIFVLDKDNREFTHLVLKALEERLEQTEASDEFFGYACTLYTELIENAFDHGCKEGGKVGIQLEVTSAFFRIIVEDTGKGFDASKELNVIKHEKADRERRRGLFQILNITKNITYNDKGNKVKAIVYRKSTNSKIITSDDDSIQMIEISGRGDSLLTREFENYVTGYETSQPRRVCLMIRTPWVASLFVTQIAALKSKLEKIGSPFCVFVENHSCYKIMKTLGITELVKTYESMDEAVAYLNFSAIANRQAKTSSEKPTSLPGYHGKPKSFKDSENATTEMDIHKNKNK